MTPAQEALTRARELAAADYPEISICRVGILSGQWDGGEVVRSRITEAEVAILREREEAQE